MSRKRKPHLIPGKTRSTIISIGEYGEEHCDMIDMEREVQRVVRRITDHQEIVKH